MFNAILFALPLCANLGAQPIENGQISIMVGSGAPDAMVELLIIDPLGRRKGRISAFGPRVNEIPKSSYVKESADDDVSGARSPQAIFLGIDQPITGSYRLSMFAKASTGFVLRIRTTNENSSLAPVTNTPVTGSLAAGATAQFALNFNPAAIGGTSLKPVLDPEPFAKDRLAACSSLNITGKAASSGPIKANGEIVVSGNALVTGDAIGNTIRTSGRAQVTGIRSELTNAISCTPFDLTPVRALLEIHNDNGSIPVDSFQAGVLSVTGGKTVTMPAGDYLVDRIEVADASKIVPNGLVHIFIRHSLTLTGHAVVGSPQLPITIYSDSSGDLVMDGASKSYAVIYAPKAGFSMRGQSRFIGSVHAGRIDLAGDARVDTP